MSQSAETAAPQLRCSTRNSIPFPLLDAFLKTVTGPTPVGPSDDLPTLTFIKYTLWRDLPSELRRYFVRHATQWPLLAQLASTLQGPVGGNEPLACLDTLGFATRDEWGPHITSRRRWLLGVAPGVSAAHPPRSLPVLKLSAETDDQKAHARLTFTTGSAQAACEDALLAALEYHSRDPTAGAHAHPLSIHVTQYGGSLRVPLASLECHQDERIGPWQRVVRTWQSQLEVTGESHGTLMLFPADHLETDGRLTVDDTGPHEVDCLSFALQLLYALAAVQVAIPGVSLAFRHLSHANVRMVQCDPAMPPLLYKIVPRSGQAVFLDPCPSPPPSPSAEPGARVLTRLHLDVDLAGGCTPVQRTFMELVTMPPEYLFYKGAARSELRGNLLHSTTFSAGMIILSVASILNGYKHMPLFSAADTAGQFFTGEDAVDCMAGVLARFTPPASFLRACTRTPTEHDPAPPLLSQAEAVYLWNLIEMVGLPPASGASRTADGSPRSIHAGAYEGSALLTVIEAHRGELVYARAGRGWLFREATGSLESGSSDDLYEAWLQRTNLPLAREAAGLRKTLGILATSVQRMLAWEGKARNRPLNQLLVDSRNVSQGIAGYRYASAFQVSAARARACDVPAPPVALCVLDTRALHPKRRSRGSAKAKGGKRAFRVFYHPLQPPAGSTSLDDPVIPGTNIVPYYYRHTDAHPADEVSPLLRASAAKFYNRSPETPTPTARSTEAALVPPLAAGSSIPLPHYGAITPPLRCRRCNAAAHMAVEPIPFCSHECYAHYVTSPATGEVPENPPPLVSLQR